MYLIQLKFLPFLLFFSVDAHSQLTLDGSYTGKNVYIQNPAAPETEHGYYVTSVTVNGQLLPDSVVNASDCRPKVIHPAGCYIPKRSADKTETPKSFP